MNESVTISSAPPANPGLDYVWLKAQGIKMIQGLAGATWTDYNEHDPGVTTLEQLCYALTELSYRAELPIEDLLTRQCQTSIDGDGLALYQPEAIFSCAPVTVNDYRRLFIDRIPGLLNVWLMPHQRSGVNGLYRIYLYQEAKSGCDSEDDFKRVEEDVRRLYHQHRGLCEDLVEVGFLQPLSVRVIGKVLFKDEANGVMVLARLLFRLSVLLAPEVQRTSLQHWMAQGLSSRQIFNGPLLHHGLIEPSQLQFKPNCIAVATILSTLMQVDGVAGVIDIRAKTETIEDGVVVHGIRNVINIAPNQYLQLDLSSAQSHGDTANFGLKLMQKGLELTLLWQPVLLELARLQQDFRRCYDLDVEYDKYCAFPQGIYRDVAQYSSVQNQFPGVYGIGEAGLASAEPCARHAQARQLKGFLLVFDQLMANYLAQLGNVENHYSINSAIDSSATQHYAYQYLEQCVPGVPGIEELLKTGKQGYAAVLPSLMHSQHDDMAHREQVLNFLLAMHGQTLEDLYLPPGAALQRRLEAKSAWLQHLVQGTHDRGQAVDIGGACSADNIAGMQIKSRIQLGMTTKCQQPLYQLCTSLSLTLVEQDDEATMGQLQAFISDDLKSDFVILKTLAGLSRKGPDKAQHQHTAHNSLLQAQRVTEAFICGAADIANYRLGSHGECEPVVVLCRAMMPAQGWHFIAQFADTKTAVEGAYAFWTQACQLYQCFSQLYLVEHILLRDAGGRVGFLNPINERFLRGRSVELALSEKAQLLETKAVHEISTEKVKKTKKASAKATVLSSGFNYSCSLSVVISVPAAQVESEAYKTQACRILRANTPSHILLHCYFIYPRQLQLQFERLYWGWRHALKARRSEEQSGELQYYLQMNVPDRSL